MALEITTARLRLRPLKLESVAEVHRLWTDADIRRHLWDDEIISLELTAAIVNSSFECFKQQGFGQWGIYLHGCDELIGFSGFRFIDDSTEIEILYGLASRYWGQGLATEAAIALLHYGFEVCQFQQVFAGVNPPNVASLRVAKRIGMKYHHSLQTPSGEVWFYKIEREEFLSKR